MNKALSFISNYINKEVKLIFGLSEDIVMLSSLVNPDGSISGNLENKIVISIINIEHQTVTKDANDEDKYGKITSPVFLNLFVLISANYSATNYLEGLKVFSTVIGIIHANPSFSRNDFPDMDPSADKLDLEIHNIPLNELGQIWNGIGAKYVPSIICKVKMICIQKNSNRV